MDSISQLIASIGQKAKKASNSLRVESSDAKNNALVNIASEIKKNQGAILDANNNDLLIAKNNNIDDALLDRLMLNEERLLGVVEGLEQIVSLDDPIGRVSELVKRPSGIKIGKMSVPLGVIGMIYESRPNVTIDAAALCLSLIHI